MASKLTHRIVMQVTAEDHAWVFKLAKKLKYRTVKDFLLAAARVHEQEGRAQ